MIIQGLAFYLFSAIVVAAGAMVVSARNPVHSVLFLILAFFNAAGLFVLMGAEFLAMILVVVYVGAVAVLFLFVVMMLDVDFAELKQGFLSYMPVGVLVAFALAGELFLVAGAATSSRGAPIALAPEAGDVTNAEAIGRVLYTDYLLVFQMAGLVLFVAMVGAIVLTLRHKASVKRQDINVQNARTPEIAMAVRKVAPGQGLSDADAAEWVK